MASSPSLTLNAKPVWKEVLRVAWPLIVANSFWNLQMTIDRIFLGAYSTEALGAAMAVMGVFWVPMALLQQTAAYVSTFVAQYFGAGEHSRVGASLWQALYVAVFGGVAFLGLMAFSPMFFRAVGHSQTIQVLEVQYFNAMTYSALPTALVAAVSGFYSGLGNTKAVLWINLVGLVLNAALDAIMIFGRWGFPALGVAGAGYATAIATYGAALMGLFWVFGSKIDRTFRIRSERRIDWELLARFLKFGIPSGLQWALEGLAFTVFLIVMGRMSNGDAALASSSIAVTVMMLSVLPSMGVAQAVMILVGQSVGEEKPEKAQEIVWTGVRVSLAYMVCVGLSFAVAPEFYLSWFRNAENAVLWGQVSALASSLLKVVAVFTIFDCVYLNVSFALKGAGDTRFVSVLALVMPWPLFVMPAFLIRHWENAVWLSWVFVAGYSFCITGALVWRFRRGHWKSMNVIKA